MELTLIVWLVCGVLGAVLAQSKNRSPLTGGLVGLLGGPIGVFVLACLRKLGPGETERKGLGTPVKVLVIATAALVAVIVGVAVLLPTDDGPAQAAAPAPAAATEAVGITIRLAALLNRDAKKPAAACADAAAGKGKLLRVKLLIPELQRTRSLSAADLASVKKENKRQRRLLRACAAAGY